MSVAQDAFCEGCEEELVKCTICDERKCIECESDDLPRCCECEEHFCWAHVKQCEECGNNYCIEQHAKFTIDESAQMCDECATLWLERLAD